MEHPVHRPDAQEIELDDEHRLADLGYKQELTRDWSVMHNFGVSFSIIVSLQLGPLYWTLTNTPE
jgi:hypothetical protein